MKYLAPALVVFALLTGFAYGQAGAILTATVTKDGHSDKLYSNIGFPDLLTCQRILATPPLALQNALDDLREKVEAAGGTIEFGCELPRA